jgi:integrase
MFAGRTGLPLRPDNLTDRFNKLAAAAGVRPLGPHQIRRLLVATLLEAGYSMHEVAERCLDLADAQCVGAPESARDVHKR